MKRPGCIYLDVSDLPAPEPLQKALEALAELSRDQFLHFHHRQYPTLLYERLKQRGFEELTHHASDGTVNVYIWRRGNGTAARHAREAMENHEAAEG